MKRKLMMMVLFGLSSTSLLAQRSETNLRQWQFSRDGQTWQQVTVPHDWAISGPFRPFR